MSFLFLLEVMILEITACDKYLNQWVPLYFLILSNVIYMTILVFMSTKGRAIIIASSFLGNIYANIILYTNI